MTKNTQHAEIYARFECDTKVAAEDVEVVFQDVKLVKEELGVAPEDVVEEDDKAVNDEESLETEYEDGDCTEESIDQDSPKTEHQIQVNSCPWMVG